MRTLFLLLAATAECFAQASGVGQLWTVVSGTLQSGATASGNGTALAVGGLSSATLTVNCSVACSGGTTINFEASQDGTNYAAVFATQLGTNTLASTVVNQGTTITVWETPIGGLANIRARISAYSAGTITVTASATAAPYNPVVVNTNGIAGTAVLGHVIADSGSTTAATQATASNLNAAVVGVGTAGSASGGVLTVQGAASMTKLLVTPDANSAVNATLSAETTKVIGTTRVVGNAGGAVDAATGAAPPANAVLIGGLTSGATSGFVTAVPICDSFQNINHVTASTFLEITGVSGRHVRICHIDMIAAGADNVAVISGTGATCGTGSAAIIGTTAATGYNLAANTGIAAGSGIGTIMRTVAAGDSVCIITSAAVQLSGMISYTIY